MTRRRVGYDAAHGTGRRRRRRAVPSIRILAFGDTAGEIEQDALDEARAVFGSGATLAVRRDYRVNAIVDGGILAPRGRGRKYVAAVTVEEIAG